MEALLWYTLLNWEVAQNKSTSLRMRALGYKQILAPFKTFQGKWNEKRNGFLITITFNKMILHAKINNLALIIHYAFMMIDKSKMAMFLHYGDNLCHFLLIWVRINWFYQLYCPLLYLYALL